MLIGIKLVQPLINNTNENLALRLVSVKPECRLLSGAAPQDYGVCPGDYYSRSMSPTMRADPVTPMSSAKRAS
jgi:hypothetical protein